MLLVIGFSMLMLGLALVVTQSVIRQIVPSNRADHSYSALAAAEAGIFDYHKHLLDDPTYYLADEDNPAVSGWVEVPGYQDPDGADNPSGDSEYRIVVDRTRLGSAGELVVFAIGRSPRNLAGTSGDGTQVVRAVQAIWSKRSTLDYVYMSDIETPAPDLPGAYSTAANSGGTGKTAQQVARLLCSRRWYQAGQIDPSGTQGNQRNLNFCQWAGIYTSEKLVGRLHTNDVWRLEATNLTNTVTPGYITSSCRNSTEGLVSGEVGCGTVRRFISTTASGLNSNNGANAKWTASTTFQGDAWRPSNSAPDPTGIKTAYASVLELPNSPALLKKRSGDTGCVYTGPTRFRFTSDGYVFVTSPDTKFTSSDCGGGPSGNALMATSATSQPTVAVNLASFVDPVFYVQDVQRPAAGGADPDPDFDYDTPNEWASVTPPTLPNEPSCQPKFGTNIYPFVIPNAAVDSGEAAGFNGSATGLHYKGFPSELADPASPWYSSNCALGDAYVQGKFNGRVTLATEGNIVLTSTLADSTSSTVVGANYGKPATTSESIIGLVSKKFTYIYRPFAAPISTNPPKWVGDWKEANSRDPVFNFAILAIDQCFAAQDPYTATSPSDPTYGDRNGNIYLWGSLAQKYRCVVGSTGGYNKVYKYDDRLMRSVPPAMLELSDEDWGTETTDSDAAIKAPFSEITPVRMTYGETDAWFPLSIETDYSSSISNVRVMPTGSAGTTPAVQSMAYGGGTAWMVHVEPTGPGVVIIRYDVTHGSQSTTAVIKESRSMLVWVDDPLN